MNRLTSVIAFGLATLAMPWASYGEPKWGRNCTECHTPGSTGRFTLLNPSTTANPPERPGATDYGTLPVFQVRPGQAVNLQISLLTAATGDGYGAKLDGFDEQGVVNGNSLVSPSPLFGTDCHWSRWMDYTYVDPYEQYTWPYGPTSFSFFCSTASTTPQDYYPLRFALVGRNDATGELFYEELRFYLQVTDTIPALGDLDCDGALTVLDVDDFVQALIDPAAYADTHDGDPNPPCNSDRGDMNHDQLVDGRDIQGFVNQFSGFVPVEEYSCISCHSSPRGPWAAVVNADGRGGHHMGTGTLNDGDCQTCHDVSQHQSGSVRLWGNPNTATLPFAVNGTPQQLNSFCSSCHTGANAETIHTTSTAWQPACTECHAVHDTPQKIPASLQGYYWRFEEAADPVVDSGPNGLNGTTAGAPSRVTSVPTTPVPQYDLANTQSFYTNWQDINNSGRVLVNDPSGKLSMGDQNFTIEAWVKLSYLGGNASVDDRQFLCQKKVDLATDSFLDYAALVQSGNLTGSPAYGKTTGITGRELALVFGSGTASWIVMSNLQIIDNNWHFVGFAHDAANNAVRFTLDSQSETQTFTSGHPAHYPSAGPLLIGGHRRSDGLYNSFVRGWIDELRISNGVVAAASLLNAVGTSLLDANEALIARSIRNQTLGADLPVIFKAKLGAGSFNDGVGANDGVCQVCHTATNHHRYDGSGTTHREGTDCTACHTHQVGFMVSQTSCIACHDQSQGARRAITSEFGLASHHVKGAAVTDADCQVCHDISLHTSGNVRLKNVDSPTTIITLAGNPLTSQTEATKLEPFCLACHDANGAAGSPPFSNGTMPSAIDAAKWAASSHALGRTGGGPKTTCMGDGETFGCHSNGHGSQKTKMQAPWNLGQSAVSGDANRQEEGMCYSCHDSNGPAQTDTQTRFSLTSHHKVSAVDQTNGAKLECKNCHNPHTNTSTNKVINPGTGAFWTGTMEGFCLVCHDGTPPTGVSFPSTASGTGFNKSSFVNSMHDTTTGTDSCRHCHANHGSAQPSLLLARYDTNDATYTSTTGNTNLALCTSCHPLSKLLGSSISFNGSDGHNKSAHRRNCIICHDAHRSYDAGEAGLIDWNYPATKGTYQVSFPSGRNGSSSYTPGSCYINCHGRSHAYSHSRGTYNNLVTTVPNTNNCWTCHINGRLIP